MFTLCSYQKRIVGEIVNGMNAIVILPTGAGKTAIAAEIIRLRLPSSTPKSLLLFLVPTRMLVEQQASALELCCGVEVACYHGEISFPKSTTFKILVCTPSAFIIAQQQYPNLIGWSNVSHVTFDEVHHVLKEHPYRKIAKQISSLQSPSPSIEILGLTASISYAITEAGIRKSISQIVTDFNITKVVTASTQEFRSSGFTGNRTQADVITAPINDTKYEVFDILEEGSTIRLGNKPVPISMRKSPSVEIFWKRVDSNQSTTATRMLLAALQEVESCAQNVVEFTSPIASDS